MNIDMNIITNWKFLFPSSIALFSLLFSIFNFTVGRFVANRITKNDLLHLTKDVKELKDNNEKIEGNLRDDLNKIFRRLGKIDRGLAVRKAICNERHSKDRK